MSILPLTIPPKKLAQTISSSAMSFKLNNIQGWRGVDLVPGDFGTEAYCVFINSTRTQIEIMKFDPATIADSSITILARGLGYTGGDTPVTANQFPWASNDTTVQLGTDAPQLFRDFLSESNPATVTALHTYNVLPQSAQTPTNDEDLATKSYVDGLTSPAITVTINQVSHGFVAGDVIRLSGVNTYAKAQADSEANAEVSGIVIEAVSADIFKYITDGIVEDGVPVEAAGTVLFLDPSTAGALTATEPTTIGQVNMPLAVVSESGVKMIFHKYRGAVLSTIAGNPIASETTAGIVEQATPAQVAAGTDTGETGAPLFVVPSLIPEPTLNTLFGDGSDGDVTISSGTTTLTRDMFYNNLTVNGTGVLVTAGYEIFVKGTLTVDGSSGAKIHNSGVDGSDGQFSAVSSLGGAGGAGGLSGKYKGGVAGGDGGNGVSNSNGLPGTNGLPSGTYSITNVVGTAGGTGGTSIRTPGAGGTAGIVTSVAVNKPRSILNLSFIEVVAGSAVIASQSLSGGAGGGGAGSGGNGGYSGGGGGGGGGNGGIVVICANALDITGASAIQSRGGDGGDGGGAASAGANSPGPGGGGGAGNGGIIVVAYLQKTGTGTMTADAGVGGQPGAVGGGSSGPGVAGGNGAAGIVIEIS
jgi:hypothetical protein